MDVMLDFETFGNGKNACIVQVGAVYFNRDTGEIYEEFKCNIDARSSQASGADLDADTVYWWLARQLNAIDSITAQPLVDIEEAMLALNEFLGNATAIWSHATFDFVILSETLKRLKIKPTFPYRVARDIRTLKDLAGYDVATIPIVREGTHHDALDDCKFQVKYCVESFQMLKG